MGKWVVDPMIAAAFPRMMAIDNRCHNQAVSRRSPVDCDIRLPSSLKNRQAAGPTTPDVSTATGTKRYCSEMDEYRWILRFSAALAAEPGLIPSWYRFGIGMPKSWYSIVISKMDNPPQEEAKLETLSPDPNDRHLP